MSSLGYAPVILPSLGLLNDGKIPEGRIHIRKLTVGDEMILQSSVSGSAMVSAIISACTKLPDKVTAGDLLSADRMAILIALRVYTFGPKYGYTFKCASCGASNKAECDISTDIRQRQAVADLVEPLEVRLSDADATVSLRFLRGRDDDAVAKSAKRPDGDQSHVTRMALSLMKINGEDAGDLQARERFVRNLTMVDGADFRQALEDREPGMDTTLTPECTACGAANTLALPFSIDFFRPTRH